MKVLHLMELDLSEEYILNLKCPQQFILATIADLSELAVLDEPNAPMHWTLAQMPVYLLFSAFSGSNKIL